MDVLEINGQVLERAPRNYATCYGKNKTRSFLRALLFLENKEYPPTSKKYLPEQCHFEVKELALNSEAS